MKPKYLLPIAALFSALPFAATSALAAPDANAGKAVYARCAICHDVKPGVNKMGPSLSKMWGRKAGAVQGFNYSPAMRSSKIVWNKQTLDKFLTAPMKTIPGTRMAFAGISNANDRANLLAYLETVTK